MVEDPPDHGLIMSMRFFRLAFEKPDACLAQSDRDPNVIFLLRKLFGRRKKILDHFEAHGLIRVFYFLFHKPPFPCANIRHR